MYIFSDESEVSEASEGGTEDSVTTEEEESNGTDADSEVVPEDPEQWGVNYDGGWGPADPKANGQNKNFKTTASSSGGSDGFPQFFLSFLAIFIFVHYFPLTSFLDFTQFSLIYFLQNLYFPHLSSDIDLPPSSALNSIFIFPMFFAQ